MNCARRIKMPKALLRLSIALLASLAASPGWSAQFDLAEALAKAKAGDTVLVPAGIFRGPVVLPPGVNLRGAGIEKTIIDAGGAETGVLLNHGRTATLADFTVQGASLAGVRIDGGSDLTLSSLRVLRSFCGVNVLGASQLRLENLILAENRTGLALNDVRHSSVVNNTLADNYALGFSISKCRAVVVFNNVVSGSDVGICLPQNNDALQMDYNLWNGKTIGKLEGELMRHTTTAWAALTGHERHSVGVPIAFSNPAADDYRPASTLSWRPAYACTAGWGVPEFAGVIAPATDIRGQARGQSMDVGAYATARQDAGAAHGQISFQTDEGVKSAGVFHKDGKLLCYLFQGLPLRKGTYEFWLPQRDFLSQPIAAGQYEVRTVESPLSSEYFGYAANTGSENFGVNANDMHVQEIAYADDGRLIVCNGWQEKGINISDMDPATGKSSWDFGGSSGMDGVAIGPNHLVYVLKQGVKNLELVQIDTRTGAAQPWPDQDYKRYFAQFKHTEAKSRLAYLRGRLYLSDQEGDRLYHASATNPEFQESFSVAGPDSPAGDEKRGLLWLISGGEAIVALDEVGHLKQRFDKVPKPVALALRNDRLAIASAETGKVHVFDCSNPAELKPLFTIGTGEDPLGSIQPDRFEFKESKLGGPPCRCANLAVGPSGEIGVLHNTRIALFDPAGKLVRDTWADFCWDMFPMTFGDAGPTRFFHARGTMSSFSIDVKTRRWQPDANWGFPKDSTMSLFFSLGGKRYATGPVTQAGAPARWLICQVDGYVGHVVAEYLFDASTAQWVVRRDTNGDGKVDEHDATAPWTDAAGQPLKHLSAHSFSTVYPARDGSLRLVMQNEGRSPWDSEPAIRAPILRIEPDETGVPRLVADPQDAARMADVEIASPFDPAKVDSLSRLQAGNGTLRNADGGWVYMPSLSTSPAMIGNIVNGSGSDLAGYDASGRLRWLRTLTEAGPVIGLCGMQGLNVVGSCWEAELYTMNSDGLSTGNVGLPLAAHFRFGVMDHPSVLQPFVGNDGQPYYLMGDFVVNCVNWFALRNVGDIRQTKTPLRIDPGRAEALRGQAPTNFSKPQPKLSKVVVRKLSAPLPIDGDLVKWRTAGVTPQIVITPDGAGSGIKGPADTSAIVRLAYEADNLYVQVLKFDDKAVMFQSAPSFYKQDGIEMSINGFAMGGFKYNLTRVREEGDYLFRDRWFSPKLCIALDAQVAPRKIALLNDAQQVEERKVIENIYGVDLANSPVIVFEFKLPMQAVYNQDQAFNKEMNLAEHRVEMTSGSTFRLGFTINDSDQPGADIQKVLMWPASYHTWAALDHHAEATLE